MKTKDWNGHPVPLLVQCFSDHANIDGVTLRIRASTEEEAVQKVHDIVEEQHGPFHRRTNGNYKIKFNNLKHLEV